MFYDLIECRSLTYAQRMVNVLERSGLDARLVRTPRRISPAGCGYSVRVPRGTLASALAILEQIGLPVKAAYSSDDTGSYKEVEL